VRYGPQVARYALGMVLAGLVCLACAPAQPLAQAPGSEGSAPPVVLPTGTLSLHLPPAPTLTPPPAEALAAAPAQHQGPVLWVGGEGCLTALGPQGWRTFELSGIVRDIAIDPDGNAIVAPGLRVCNGRLLRDLQPHAPGGEQDAVAIDPQGRIWVGYYGGIAVLEGGHWQLVPVPASHTSTRARTIRDLAIDSRGVVWVATGEGLASYDGQAWQVRDEKAGPGLVTTECLLVDRQGGIWVGHEKGLSVLRGNSWEHLSLDVAGFVRAIAPGADGHILVGAPYLGISRYDGYRWWSFADDSSGLPGNGITALAVDAQGRIWAGTRYGLCVYDGQQWHTYLAANSGLGADRVSALAAGGQALDALPPIGPTRYGSLSGQVTLHRRPVPGVRVVLCSEIVPGQAEADLPCQGTRFSLTTLTGIDGRYLFEQVPLGHYAVAAEIEPQHWVTPMRVLTALQYPVREGQVTVVDPIEGAVDSP